MAHEDIGAGRQGGKEDRVWGHLCDHSRRSHTLGEILATVIHNVIYHSRHRACRASSGPCRRGWRHHHRLGHSRLRRVGSTDHFEHAGHVRHPFGDGATWTLNLWWQGSLEGSASGTVKQQH